MSLLFTTPDVHYGTLEVDGSNLYWATGLGLSGSDSRVWRGGKDGAGTAVDIAHGWSSDVFDLALTSTAIYWIVECDDASYLIRAAKSGS